MHMCLSGPNNHKMPEIELSLSKVCVRHDFNEMRVWMCVFVCVCVGGGGVWNSLISKNLVHYSLVFAYSLKIIHYSLKC